mmetsp:Transcript_610/g.1269  ORF Transcript_610/g.1269 Transcript_610/m.1269 type:complete len:256 (-) Transcript_610:287-1054(-)
MPPHTFWHGGVAGAQVATLSVEDVSHVAQLIRECPDRVPVLDVRRPLHLLLDEHGSRLADRPDAVTKTFARRGYVWLLLRRIHLCFATNFSLPVLVPEHVGVVRCVCRGFDQSLSLINKRRPRLHDDGVLFGIFRRLAVESRERGRHLRVHARVTLDDRLLRGDVVCLRLAWLASQELDARQPRQRERQLEVGPVRLISDNVVWECRPFRPVRSRECDSLPQQPLRELVRLADKLLVSVLPRLVRGALERVRGVA